MKVKGWVLFLWNKGNKNKRVSVVWYIAKNNEYKLNSKYRRYFHGTGINNTVAKCFASVYMYWVVHES